MENKKEDLLKNAMNYGVILGFCLIILSVILYLLDLFNPNTQYISYVIILGGIIYSTINYRDTISGGSIKYGKAVGLGTLTGLCASVILAVYTFIFYKFVDPDIMEKTYVLMEESIRAQGTVPESQIDQIMEISKKFTTPFTISLGVIFNTTIVSVIISLITSAFLLRSKKIDLMQNTETVNNDNITRD